MHITSCHNHFPVTCQNDKYRKIGEAPTLCSPDLLGNRESLHWPYMWVYKKGDIEAINEMDTAEKGAHVSIIKHNWKHLQYHSACCEHHHKQASKGKILAKRMNVQIDHIENAKSRDGFLKMERKMIIEKKKKGRGAKVKGTWVQLKCHLAPPRETHFVRTTKSSWSTFPMNSWLPTKNK